MALCANMQGVRRNCYLRAVVMSSEPSDRTGIAAVPRRPAHLRVPPGLVLRLSPQVRVWASGDVLIGGAPWRISRLSAPVADLIRRMREVGPKGVAVVSARDKAAARGLLDRGFAEPVPGESDGPPRTSPSKAQVVIPVYQDAEHLSSLLASLRATRPGPAAATPALVIDDASPDQHAIDQTASAYGARLIRHAVNQGPAGARNTGMAESDEPFIAFVDADCLVDADWPDALLHHFDDPAVAAVAPRVLPTVSGKGVLARYEAARSSLDMGRRAGLVRPGARLGFVPSAALVVRRAAVVPSGFDPDLRLGEDVDLIWRLADAGWLVRYDPGIIVRHHSRLRLRPWLLRKIQYGTSAADLEARHPGRLAPARVSLASLTALGLIAIGYPLASPIPLIGNYVALSRQLNAVPRSRLLAARTVALGLVADTQSIGRALRREWWPLGAVAIAASPRSRIARTVTAVMLAPLIAEWLDTRPGMDPVRFAAMRLIDDAAYGSGVLKSCIRARTWRPLMPVVHLPSRKSGPRRT